MLREFNRSARLNTPNQRRKIQNKWSYGSFKEELKEKINNIKITLLDKPMKSNGYSIKYCGAQYCSQ